MVCSRSQYDGFRSHIKPAISHVEALGHARGFFLEPDKSQFLRALGVSEDATQAITPPLECILGKREIQIGFLVGSDEANQRCDEYKVENWVAWVNHLAGFARAFPHKNYNGLKMFHHQEWQSVQKITPGVGNLFLPMESALSDNFIPALFGRRREVITDSIGNQITWGVNQVGIGI